jgi:hypothetical protein
MCATGVRLRSPVLFVTARHLKTLTAQSYRQWHTEKSFTALPARARWAGSTNPLLQEHSPDSSTRNLRRVGTSLSLRDVPGTRRWPFLLPTILRFNSTRVPRQRGQSLLHFARQHSRTVFPAPIVDIVAARSRRIHACFLSERQKILQRNDGEI